MAQVEPGSARKVRHAAEGVGALGEDPLGELSNDIDREIDEREVDLFKCDHLTHIFILMQPLTVNVRAMSTIRAGLSRLRW